MPSQEVIDGLWAVGGVIMLMGGFAGFIALIAWLIGWD